MTNGLRMDSTRQRALFQSYSRDSSSKTVHISNTNKRKIIPDGTNDSANEAPKQCKILKIVQQNGLESAGSSNNSKSSIEFSDTIAANLKNHEDSDGECDLYELLEIDYNDDCHSHDSDVVLIENTQKAIVIEDDDVDGGQSNCASSREENITSNGCKTSCDETADQNTIVIEDEDEEDSRTSCNDQNRDKEEDHHSNSSSVIEYERWLTFRSTDYNDDDRVSSHDPIGGEFNSEALDRISVDQSDKEEEKALSLGKHSTGNDSDSNSNSCSVIEHKRNDLKFDSTEDDRVSIDNEDDAHNRISNDPTEKNLNCIVIEDDDQEAKVSKCSTTNGHSSLTNEDDKIIVIDDDDDDDDEETTSKTHLTPAVHVDDDTCSYTLVDVIDTVETKIPKPTKRESVVSFRNEMRIFDHILIIVIIVISAFMEWERNQRLESSYI